MNGNLRLVLGLGAIAIAAAVGLSLFAARTIPSVGGPTATPSPSPVPTPSSPPSAARPGPLAAGANFAVNFDPGLRFAVPAGWKNLADDSSSYGLQGPNDGDPGVYCPDTGPNWADSCVPHKNEIIVTSKRVLGSDAQDCEGLALAGAPTSVDGMVEALSIDPRFVTGVPQRVTIGGFAGQTVDITLAETWTATCKWSAGAPAALVLTAAEPPGPFLGLMGREQLVLTLLDSGDGVVSITIDPYFREQAQRIIDTFEFGR